MIVVDLETILKPLEFEEPDYVVTLATETDVNVLQLKEWFDWEDESKPLVPGIPLTFRIKSAVSFKDRVSFHELSVTGEIFVWDQLKNLQKVGIVELQADDAHGNPVVAYLQHHGNAQSQAVPLASLSLGWPGDQILVCRPNNPPTHWFEGEVHDI